MFWRIVAYPILILVTIAVTTVFEFALLPLGNLLRRNRRAVPFVMFAKETIASITAVLAALTIANHTRLSMSVAIIIVTFLLHVQNTMRRLKVAEAGGSAAELAARARGESYDRVSEIKEP